AEAARSAGTFALEDIVLAAVPSEPSLNGLRLVDVANRLKLDPVELVLSLIERDGLSVVMTAFGMSDADVCRVLSHPRAIVGSDGWVLYSEAPGHPHPRNFSYSARFLTSYVRDRRIVELERAVQMLSTAPADRLGLVNRGRLVPGAAADIVAFDYEGLHDRATYEQPSLAPEGVIHVLVAGEPAVQSGKITGRRSGRVLQRVR
ncbi:MAG: amidohydrolase family protein, partial [Actinomycetota bacterium]|nr:amidohydrolase family protein [Actinomycetota bacterium]